MNTSFDMTRPIRTLTIVDHLRAAADDVESLETLASQVECGYHVDPIEITKARMYASVSLAVVSEAMRDEKWASHAEIAALGRAILGGFRCSRQLEGDTEWLRTLADIRDGVVSLSEAA